MTYDQAVAVVKEAMRSDCPALVQPHEEYDHEFTVTLFPTREGQRYTAYSACLDALDRATARR